MRALVLTTATAPSTVPRQQQWAEARDRICCCQTRGHGHLRPTVTATTTATGLRDGGRLCCAAHHKMACLVRANELPGGWAESTEPYHVRTVRAVLGRTNEPGQWARAEARPKARAMSRRSPHIFCAVRYLLLRAVGRAVLYRPVRGKRRHVQRAHGSFVGPWAM